MAHGLGLLPEGDSILIVIRALCHQVSRVNESLGQRKVTGIPTGAIHLDDAHVMRRTDGIVGQRAGRRVKGSAEVVGGPPGNIQQCGFSGGTIMHTGACHQVAHVVGFEVQPILKLLVLLLILTLSDDNRCVKIAVFAL